MQREEEVDEGRMGLHKKGEQRRQGNTIHRRMHHVMTAAACINV